jgi:hypothetical protein
MGELDAPMSRSHAWNFFLRDGRICPCAHARACSFNGSFESRRVCHQPRSHKCCAEHRAGTDDKDDIQAQPGRNEAKRRTRESLSEIQERRVGVNRRGVPTPIGTLSH